jgi:hypothetical protein
MQHISLEISMKKYSHTGFSLLFLPLATVAMLGTSSIKTHVDAQYPPPIIPAQSTPGNSPAANQPGQRQKLNTQKPNTQKPEATVTNLPSETPEEKYQKKLEEYQDKLLHTVLLTVLGTVVAISLTFFGYQVFANVIGREQDRKSIQNDLENSLRVFVKEEIKRFELNLSAKHRQIETKLKWIEYQICSFSAQQLEIDKMPEVFDDILKDRRRAIETLQDLQDLHQGSLVDECLATELEAIHIFCYGLNSEKLEINSESQAEIRKLKTILNKIKDYKTYTDKIEQELNKLLPA